MPLGKYRRDPHEMTDREQDIYAAQHAEGAMIVFGVGFMLAVFALRWLEPGGAVEAAAFHTLATAVAPIVGGFLGYVLGHWHRTRLIRRIADEEAVEQEQSA